MTVFRILILCSLCFQIGLHFIKLSFCISCFRLFVFHELIEQDRCFTLAVDADVFDGFIGPNSSWALWPCRTV